MVTPSSSISSSAVSGSNRPSIMMSRSPARRPTTRVEWQPETWNSGDVNSETFWPLGVDGISSSPVTMAPYTLVKNVFCMLAIMLRWVLTAPFGRPGRAARVEDDGGVVLVDRCGRGVGGGGGGELVEAADPVVAVEADVGRDRSR